MRAEPMWPDAPVTKTRMAVLQVMSVAVISVPVDDRNCHPHLGFSIVGRWEPGARGRLEQAALELYSERGFDSTTVAEIAERAGLTERTFFRYFADEREAL